MGAMGTDAEAQDVDAGDASDAADAEDDADLTADADDNDEGEMEDSACHDDMVLLDDGTRRFCIDRYEASLVEVLDDGTEVPYPHYLPVDGHAVRAVSVPGVFPQGFISEVQAADACTASGKRLCAYDEWQMACMGPSKTTFPYGNSRQPGVCHDTGKSAVGAIFGAKALAASTHSATRASPKGKPKHANRTKGRLAQSARASTMSPHTKTASRAMKSPLKSQQGKGGKSRTPAKAAKPSVRPASVEPSVWTRLNEPALGQVEGALARTGEHSECVNGYGVYDMVGNVHEWVATDPRLPYGTFAGGYYLDTTQNGPGCRYKTQAHAHDYHDYSTGFRCCADPATGQ